MLAFTSCDELTSVFIPYSVHTIGTDVFRNSNDLLTIYAGNHFPPNGWHQNWNPDNRPVI